jgi:hypothetical protein
MFFSPVHDLMLVIGDDIKKGGLDCEIIFYLLMQCHDLDSFLRLCYRLLDSFLFPYNICTFSSPHEKIPLM